MRFLDKILDILISNVAGLATFYVILHLGAQIVPAIMEYYKIPLAINIIYLLWTDIKILMGE